MDNTLLINKLAKTHDLTDGELAALIEDKTSNAPLAAEADKVRREVYGDEVFLRGLIEFTNFCKNDCYYCGIRCSNRETERYRLTPEQILACCEEGYALGYRTFVLQGGEDPYFTDERVCEVVSAITKRFPDCAVTLSIGEKSYESYKAFREAGARRYLLRHETADFTHYGRLHPPALSAENRQRCLFDLKALGYQVGSGFMVGSPYQTTENLAMDLKFLEEFQPEMCGIGPFIPHHDTPFSEHSAGSVELTCFLLSVIRIICPKVLLPATTALGSLDPEGREKGILSGANVVMPNLSPANVRSKYLLYDGKLAVGAEAAENLADLKRRMEKIGYMVVEKR